MSDWNEIVDFIHDPTQAVDEAHGASEESKQTTNPDTFDPFRAKMEELHEHLSNLKTVLDDAGAFVIDELMDALSKAYSGHEADYRRTPRMK